MFIFVYGSLKKGFKFNYFLEDYKAFFIGKAKTVDKFYLQRYEKASFPFMYEKPEKEIIGELYEISEDILIQLDFLEGYPVFYNRKEIKVISNNIEYNAIVYFLNEKNVDLSKESLSEWTIDLENN